MESCELHPRVVAALAVECGGKADVIGLLGEIVARRTFVPEGFADPRDYCVRALRMSGDQAVRRLRAARTAHQFPALFPAIADGRLGVTAVNTLGPHLSSENCDELVALAAGRTIEELERALRARQAPAPAPVLERVADSGSPMVADAPVETVPQAPAPADSDVSLEMAQPTEPVFEAPAPVVRRVGLTAQLQEKLEYAKALLAHVTRDEGEVLERALDTLIAKLEAKKFGKTERPRAGRASSNPRYIPMDVRRKVYVRDEGRCTFVGDHGHRCETRDALQFDHIITFADGGKSTVPNLRLRCRAHNHLEAERRFGAGFMQRKRQEREALAPELVAKQEDLINALRNLGYTATQAKSTAARCADRLDLSFENLFCLAMKYLAPPSARRTEAPAPAAVTGTVT